jgi:hypothetical protein
MRIKSLLSLVTVVACFACVPQQHAADNPNDTEDKRLERDRGFEEFLDHHRRGGALIMPKPNPNAPAKSPPANTP